MNDGGSIVPRPTPARTQAPSVSLLADQTLVTITVGQRRKPFTIHKGLLCSNSKYFETLQEVGQSTIHLPDVAEDIMGLFQWWLYAQPSRSVASDPPIPGKLNANDAFSILRSRNAKYIAQNQARHHRYEAVLKGEVNHLTYSEVLAYGRRNIPPLWFPQDDFDAGEGTTFAHNLLFFRFFVFASRYDVKLLREDIMTVLVALDMHSEDLPGANLSLSLIRTMATNLPSNAALRNYWEHGYALVNWSSSSHRRILARLPIEVLANVTFLMSAALNNDHEQVRDFVKDCCEFHEHEEMEDTFTCPASHMYDVSFYAGFLRVCVDASNKFEETHKNGCIGEEFTEHEEEQQETEQQEPPQELEQNPQLEQLPEQQPEQPEQQPEHQTEQQVKQEPEEPEPPRKRQRQSARNQTRN